MANLLESVFHVPRDRHSRFLLLFAFAFSTAGSYVVSRAVGDSLFLSRMGPQHLPEMYFISALAVAAVSIAYARLSSRISLHQSFRIVLLLLFLASITLPFMLQSERHHLLLLGCVYLLAQLRGALGTIQLTTLMSEVFVNRPPARLVGLVGFGSTLAGMLLGGIVGVEADELGTTNLLYVVAAFDVVGLGVLQGLIQVTHARGQRLDVAPIGVLPGAEAENQADGRLAEPPWRTIARSPLAISIALMVGIQTITLTIIEFQWKMAAHNAFHDSIGPNAVETTSKHEANSIEEREHENELTSFFGSYYAVIYAITGVLQLFVTGGYLTRWGLLPALLIFPGALMAGSVGILLASPVQVTLRSATLTKGFETLRRGVYDAALYLLYWPMEPFVRRRAIAFSVGVAKPCSEAMSGLIIMELALYFSARHLSYVVLLLVSLWLVLALGAYRQYIVLGGRLIKPGADLPDPVLE